MGKWKGLPHEPIHLCHATAKHSGLRCKQFAMTGKKVCYYHGGKSTGAKNPPIKHGFYTKESIAIRKRVSKLVKLSKQIMNDMQL